MLMAAHQQENVFFVWFTGCELVNEFPPQEKESGFSLTLKSVIPAVHM